MNDSSLGQKRNGEAREPGRQATLPAPDSARAHFDRGMRYAERGCYEQALDAWQQVVRLQPGHAQAYVHIGGAFLELGCWQEAVTAFEQAIHLQPDRIESHYGLGMARGQLGQFEAAIAAFHRAARLQSSHAGAPENRATLPPETTAPPVATDPASLRERLHQETDMFDFSALLSGPAARRMAAREGTEMLFMPVALVGLPTHEADAHPAAVSSTADVAVLPPDLPSPAPETPAAAPFVPATAPMEHVPRTPEYSERTAARPHWKGVGVLVLALGAGLLLGSVITAMVIYRAVMAKAGTPPALSAPTPRSPGGQAAPRSSAVPATGSLPQHRRQPQRRKRSPQRILSPPRTAIAALPARPSQKQGRLNRQNSFPIPS